MNPTHRFPPPDNQPDQQADTARHTVVPVRRTPRGGLPRSLRIGLRRPGVIRPSTVWPCAQGDHHAGTAVIADWLLTAVVKIVTTYTQPGQRVLLLAPPRPLARPAWWSSSPARTRPTDDPYGGLLEATWTVARLGRGVQTRTGTPTIDQFGYTVDPTPVESESGPGLSPEPAPPAEPGPDRDRPVEATVPMAEHDGPDRFDLIIAAVERSAFDTHQPTRWAGLLTDEGVLAVITHSDGDRGQLRDPAGPLAAAAARSGLRYHDRVALLTAPVRRGALAPATAAAAAAGDRVLTVPELFGLSVRHTSVHHDLLVFTRLAPPIRETAGSADAAADNGETSDD
jgi:hypothetical protein